MPQIICPECNTTNPDNVNICNVCCYNFTPNLPVKGNSAHKTVPKTDNSDNKTEENKGKP